jgi:threonine synthase
MLRALRETGGGAVAVPDAELEAAARQLQELEGVDASPEGGAALAGLAVLVRRGLVDPGERIVVFNTGAGWLYRS